MPLPLAVLVSGSGSNLQSILDRIASGAVDAKIVLVISNNPGAYGLKRAAERGIPTQVVEHGLFASRDEYDQALLDAVTAAGARAVVLAGFMRILGPRFVRCFPQRILNIHPALLPSFAGTHGARDAAAYGVKLSGCTVHFVDEQMDHGPVVIQAAVPAEADDTAEDLAARILALEHRIYPQAVAWLAAGRLRVEGRTVHLARAGEALAALPPGAAYLVNPPLEQGF
jgi:phosphoribosylglycinamide formyltransferase-1